jgi:hypothetical protein
LALGPATPGSAWGDDELDAIVADYFAMLQLERAGQAYVKAQHNAALRRQIGRSAGSVEFKHRNISWVVDALGIPCIRGYLPAANIQDAIFDAVDRYLLANPAVLESGASAAAPGMAEAPALFETSPPGLLNTPPNPRMERLVRKWDPSLRDFRNRALGKAGERAVVDYERARLAALERPDLARKVRWVAQEDGDGAGYDILSFSRNGADRLIEVKTTIGNSRTPFFITRNERALADERPDAFRLYRLYAFHDAPALFRLKPPLERHVTMEAETFRASFG